MPNKTIKNGSSDVKIKSIQVHISAKEQVLDVLNLFLMTILHLAITLISINNEIQPLTKTDNFKLRSRF